MTNEERWDAFIVEFRNYIEENLHLDNTKGILPAPLGITKCDAFKAIAEKEVVCKYSVYFPSIILRINCQLNINSDWWNKGTRTVGKIKSVDSIN